MLASVLSVQLESNREPPFHFGRQWLWVYAEAVWIPGSAGGVFAGRQWAIPAAARLRCRKNWVLPFYKMCNYYGRQECGFKPSQYVDKHYIHTHTQTHTAAFCTRHNKAGFQNAVQVGRKPSGPVKEEPDGRNEASRKVPGKTVMRISLTESKFCDAACHYYPRSHPEY